MLSREQFERDLSNLKVLCESSVNAPGWQLVQHESGVYGIHSSSVVWEGETITQQFHVIYNNVYEVPTLWFNFYKKDGSLLDIDKIMDVVSSEHRAAIENSLLTSISQGEHPHLGVAFYHIHPCKTQDIMRNLHCSNYVLSWLSIYGQLVGLSIPHEMLL